MSISVTSRSHGCTPPQGSNCDRPWSLHSCGVTIKLLHHPIPMGKCKRVRKEILEGRELNRWELVPEGERRSDRSSTGAMEIPAGFSWTFLLARASAFTKKVSPSARGISRASAVKLRSSVSRNGRGRSPLSLFLATASPPRSAASPPSSAYSSSS